MKYFLIAGEASGDLHASNLMAALKQRDPKAEFCFLGGDLMAAQGGHQVRHYRDMAFMGIVNVLLNLRKILRNMRDTRRAIAEFMPDVVILIDYPSFNLQIAKYVKQHFDIPVYYYISPKLWAWKTYRIKSIKKYIDRMYTIFPFETEFYAKYNYKVEYVGNPTVDAIAKFRNENSDFDIRVNLGLDARPIVALLAGSRRQEIRTCLPTMVQMAERFPDYQFVVAAAPGIEENYYQKFLSPKVRLIKNATYHLLNNAHAAIINSGTATLETGIFEVPQVVVYFVPLGRFGMWVRSWLIKVPFISLVNLVAEKEIVRELIAHEFSPKIVEMELRKILENADCYATMKENYAELSRRLGGAGAAQNAAGLIVESLKN